MIKQRCHFIENLLMQDNNPISVLVIGIGGTGSRVLYNLARMDIAFRNINRRGLVVTAVDPDYVTKRNVGRQGFYMGDVGYYKSEIMINRINNAYGLNWRYETILYDLKQAKINTANIIITCVDKVVSRRIIHRTKQTNRSEERARPYYWLDFGNTKLNGQVVLGTLQDIVQPESSKFETVSKLKTVFDLYPNMEDAETDTELQGPGCAIIDPYGEQELFINSMLAEAGMSLLYSLLKDYHTIYGGLYLNLKTMQMAPMPV